MKARTIATMAWSSLLLVGAGSAEAGFTVEWSGNNATAIRNLEVGGEIYDVEFLFDNVREIYGSPAVCDFDDPVEALAASVAVNEALNSVPEVETVGPVSNTSFDIPFSVNAHVVVFEENTYDGARWINSGMAARSELTRATYARCTVALGCVADITGSSPGDPPDGQTDVFDLLMLLGEFGCGTLEGTPPPCHADISGDPAFTPPDGDTDVFDLLTLLGDFGCGTAP